MKQKLLNEFWLRVGIIVAIMTTALSWTAWAAEDVTYKLTIDASNFNTTSYAANNNEKTSNAVCTTDPSKTYEVKWTSYQVMKNSDKMQWQKSKGYIYNSTDLGTITSVTVSPTAGTYTTYYGTTEQPSSGTTVGGGYFKTSVGGATGTTSKMEITFTISEGGTPTPSLSVSPASIAFGEKAINGSYEKTFNVSFANLTEDLTVSGFSGVTVSPTTISKDAESPQTVTVTYAPTAEGSISGNVTVSNTDDEVSQTVAVTGSAYDPANIRTYDLFTGDLEEGDYIICYNGYAMKNIVSSNRLGYEEVTVTDDVISTIDASIVWHIAKDGDYWTIYNASVEKYAASTSAKNQGDLADNVSNNTNWTVTSSSGTYDFENYARSHGADSSNKWLRFNTGYGFACYTTAMGGALSLYKLHDDTPSISADDVEIVYDATSGSISYSVTNPVEGGVVTAVSSESWLTVDTPSNGTIALTCGANSVTSARTATVTLTYTYNTDETVTKDVTVTQAGAPKQDNQILYVSEEYNNQDLSADGACELNLSGVVAIHGTLNSEIVTASTTINSNNYSWENQVLTVSDLAKGQGGTVVIRFWVEEDAEYYGIEKIATAYFRPQPVIGYDGETINTHVGTPVIIDNSRIQGGAITLESSHTDVATVEGLTITPVAEGTTTITINTAAVDNTWQAGTATFTLNVTPVVDYATLPFNWDGGASADLLALDGVTANGLGTDYAVGNAPYLVKLDGTGDYIQVKTDSQPGKVTIGVKMIGGNTASTITVQQSADGKTFTDVEALSISGAQNDVLSLETSNAFATTTRYVRLLFTKGSNVGVGAITITKHSNEPSIAVSPATANPAAADVEGTLAITYSNLTIDDMSDFDIQFCNAEGEDASKPDWIEALVAEAEGGEGYVVSYIMKPNTGEAARTAYFKVYALDDEANEVYSNLVTVTQAKFVVDYATLPFDFNNGKSAIDGTTGLTQNGLGSDYSTSAKLKFDSTDDYVVLKIGDAPGTLSFDVQGNSFSGGTFYVQTSTDGKTYKNLDKVSITGSVVRKTYSDLDQDARYIKWIYAEKSNGNVGMGNISLTAAGNTRPITVTNAGYATYCSNVALDFTGTGITAYVGTRSSDKLTFSPITQVPANTGLLLVCAGGKTADVPVIASADAVENNCLTGITEYTELSGTDYILNVVDGQAGFFLTGTAHRELKANRAYIPASEGGSVKSFALDLEDNADGIEETLSDSLLKSENIYNLAGQRLSKMQKGINIVNGKKVLK